MNKTVSRLEITDICDELSEEMKRELIERQGICVSKLDSNRNEFNELKNEIKRLESDLKFANKCLITLNKFKKYLNEIRPQIENVLDLRQIQELNALENEYKIMIKKVNEISFISRLKSICSDNGSDSENEYIVNNTNESHYNLCIKEEITESNDKHSNDSNYEPINEDIYSSSYEINGKSIEENRPKVVNTFLCDYPNCGFVAKLNIVLKNHKRSHTGADPYACILPGCDFVGKTHKSLYCHKYKSHMRGSEYFRYKCKLCDYRCKYESDFKKHKFDKHMTYKCSYADCGKRFATSHQRSSHIKINHKNLHKYRCDECPFVAVGSSKLERHKRVHNEDWFKCDWPQCGFSCSSDDKLKIHKYRHTGIRPFPCTWPQCDQSFHIKASLSRHLRGHENNETNDENITKDSLQEKGLTFKCPVKGCDKRYSANQTLNRHLIYTTNHFELGFDPNLKLKCNECSFRCDSQKWMKCHMRVHSNEIFECQFCNKYFKTKHSLSAHLKQVHSVVKTLKCSVEDCHKEFTSDYRRSQHLCRDHKISKTFPCDHNGCDFVAKNETALEDHKHTHTGEVPYACDWVGCGYVCQNRRRLNFHNYYKHNYKMFSCDECEYKTKRSSLITKHKIMRHTTDTLFKCDYCVKKFKLESLLTNHVKRIHTDNQFKCTFGNCRQVFQSVDQRYKHMKTVHIKEHRCDWPDCDFIATCRSKLVQHKYVHTGQTPFVCDWPECGFVARTKVNLKHHRYRHTGERPYPCTWPACGKSFRTEPTLVTHMRWHNKDLCYSCEWPGCEFATHDRSHLRTHRFSHEKKAKGETTKNLKAIIKANNKLIKNMNKRNVRKPKKKSESDFKFEYKQEY